MKKFILGTVFLLSQKNEAAINKADLNKFKSKQVTVAIIDTGIDIYHKDLKNNIWTNEGEAGKDAFGHDKFNNHIDDDLNGFIDDIHGWNFIKNTNDVTDELGHGTHVAGIINQEFKKENSLSTLAPQVRLVALKYFNPDAQDEENVKNSTRAIEYANKMNFEIINYSGGGGHSYPSELKALQQSELKKIIVVAAAGNNNNNTDFIKFYPANYNLENIITVAATNNLGELVPFSNYGKKSIDIAAPGKKVLSTFPHNRYGFLSGTSQATAFISGHIAFLMGEKINKLTKPEILKSLIEKSQLNDSLRGKTKTQMALLNSD